MNIAIDSRSRLWANGSGIGTYTTNIITELQKIDEANNYSLLCCGDISSYKSNDNFHLYQLSTKHTGFFDNIYIPSFISKNNIDIYHIPQNGIGLNENIECKKVVTIHDLIPYILPETVGPGYLKRFLEEMPYIISNSDIIITVSEYSKSDILRLFPNVSADKICVTPLAADTCYRALDKNKCLMSVNDRFNFNNDYILYVGGFSSRKNVKLVIDSFIKSYDSFNKEIKLLIVGSLKDEGLNLKKYCELSKISDHVIFTGYIEDEYMSTLYNGASLFVYPSLYEGFGLPPLEAMSCGTPVITSNTTSIPEVVKDAGILIDPHSLDSLSESMVKVINDIDYSNYLSTKGLLRSKSFTWKATALKTLAAYKKAMIQE